MLVFALFSLICPGHGRRVSSLVDELQLRSSSPAEGSLRSYDEEPSRRSNAGGTSYAWRELALLCLARDPIAALKLSIAGVRLPMRKQFAWSAADPGHAHLNRPRAHGPTAASRSDDIPEFPSPALSPLSVLEVTMLALQDRDSQVAWRFASPRHKNANGRWTKGRIPWLRRPEYEKLPTYAPIVGCSSFALVGGMKVSDNQCIYFLTVHSDHVNAQSHDYVVKLARQPRIWPACYQDGQLQALISKGPACEGCWMIDEVRLVGRGGGSSRLSRGGDGGGGGIALKLGKPKPQVAAFR